MTEITNIQAAFEPIESVNDPPTETGIIPAKPTAEQSSSNTSEAKYNFLVYQMLVAVFLLILILLFKTFGGRYYEKVRESYIHSFGQNISVSQLTQTVKDVFSLLTDESSKEQTDITETALIELEYITERGVTFSDSIADDEMGFEAQGVLVDNSLLWPVNGRISDYFGCRTDPFNNSHISKHKGLDIAVPKGTKVRASLDGKVTISQYDATYGHYIVITHSDGIKTLYAHLDSRFVNVGDEVERGQEIAASGSTGNSTGPHLHFEILMGGTTRVDPLTLLPDD